MTNPEPNNSCEVCGIRVGRDGRTNAEVFAAMDAGEFRTAFGTFDYATDPPTEHLFCGQHIPKGEKA